MRHPETNDQTPVEGSQLDMWLVEVSGEDLGVSPNLTGKIMLQERVSRRHKAGVRKSSSARLCPCLSSCALHLPKGALRACTCGC